jgi:hypothetical protein
LSRLAQEARLVIGAGNTIMLAVKTDAELKAALCKLEDW